jgi:V8-like Glu-specific endopeptidase
MEKDYRKYTVNELNSKLSKKDIKAEYNSEFYKCKIEEIVIDESLIENEFEALFLKIELETDNTVLISEEKIYENRNYKIFGYPESKFDGEYLKLEYQGKIYLNDKNRHKKKYLYDFKEGQIVPGFSGAPVLNLNSGMVCGMIKSTKNTYSSKDLGGRAIPIKFLSKYIMDCRKKDSAILNNEWENILKDNISKKLNNDIIKNCINIVNNIEK